MITGVDMIRKEQYSCKDGFSIKVPILHYAMTL